MTFLFYFHSGRRSFTRRANPVLDAVQYTRRRVLALSAGTLTSGIVAGTTLTENSQATQADVNMGSLRIPDKSTLTQNREVADVTLAVDASYSWSGNTTPDKVEIILSVGSSEYSLYPIAQKAHTDDLSTSGEHTTKLTGSLTETPAYATSSFTPATEGGRKTNSLYAELELSVWGESGVGEIASASVMDSAVIETKNEEVSVNASVGGEGELEVELA